RAVRLGLAPGPSPAHDLEVPALPLLRGGPVQGNGGHAGRGRPGAGVRAFLRQFHHPARGRPVAGRRRPGPDHGPDLGCCSRDCGDLDWHWVSSGTSAQHPPTHQVTTAAPRPSAAMTRPDTAVPQPSEPADQAVSSAAPGQAAGRRARVTALLPWAGLAVSLGLWACGLTVVPVARVAVSGLGLVSVLSGWLWAALAFLLVSFCWVIGRRAANWPLAGAHLAALVTVLHATPAILYGTLRYSWAWKHVGVTDYIAHHGVDFHLGGVLGAYQGWPGFF